jgi:hypothetical protein
MPALGNRHPLNFHCVIQAFHLVNAFYLRCLPEARRVALADEALLPHFELAQSAARLPHSSNMAQIPYPSESIATLHPFGPII